MGDRTVDRNSRRLPVQLDVRGRRCVLVGGGAVARRKAERLLESGAEVICIAPDLSEPEAWPSLVHHARPYSGPEDVAGAFLVVAATDEAQVNAQVAMDARTAGALVLRADAAQDSDVSLPATFRRGALTVSFATDDISPAYAARLRREAAGLYDDRHTARLECIQRAKENPAFQVLSRPERRRHAELLAEADPDFPAGSVALVGAGPGDPGLLTLKAAERLRSAEVVLHDALANPTLLERFAPQATRIDVGKHKGHCVLSQGQINELLVAQARLGRRVVRLKGGDPCLFGRAGEEARALTAAGIPFEIVPGVSSLSAVPAFAGIPVTDRDFGRSVGAFSLHKRDGLPPASDEWDRMAAGPETLVLFMGRTQIELACHELMARGRSEDLPAALIVNGTLPNQRVVTATLRTLAAACAGLPSGPGLIVVGEAVRLREALLNPLTPAQEIPCPA